MGDIKPYRNSISSDWRSGPVIPFFGSIAELEKHIYKVNPELYCKYFLEGLEPQYWPDFIKDDQYRVIQI